MSKDYCNSIVSAYKTGESGDTEIALAYFESRASEGDMNAQLSAGLLHEHFGDQNQAIKYYKMAAEQGVTKGMLSLARIHRYADTNLARQWYERVVSLDSNNGRANYHLGDIESNSDRIVQSARQGDMLAIVDLLREGVQRPFIDEAFVDKALASIRETSAERCHEDYVTANRVLADVHLRPDIYPGVDIDEDIQYAINKLRDASVRLYQNDVLFPQYREDLVKDLTYLLWKYRSHAKFIGEPEFWAFVAAKWGVFDVLFELGARHVFSGELLPLLRVASLARESHRDPDENNKIGIARLVLSKMYSDGDESPVPDDLVEANFWRDALAETDDLLGKEVGIGVRWSGGGTGIRITRDHFVTNRHVVEDCTVVRVPYKFAQVIRKTRPNEGDLALLRIESGDEPIEDDSLDLAPPTEHVDPGEPVWLFGFPGTAMKAGVGFESKITRGIISGVGAYVPLNTSTLNHNPGGYVQHTAPSNRGNSGGPLMNELGDVVALATGQWAGQSVNYAIPVSDLLDFLKDAGIGRGFVRITDKKDRGQDLVRKGDTDDPDRNRVLNGMEVKSKAERFTVPITCWKG